MGNWQEFVKNNCDKDGGIKREESSAIESYGVYPSSVRSGGRVSCFMAREGINKVLVVTAGTSFDEFEGKMSSIGGLMVKVCPLSVKNSKVIRDIFSFANPSSAKGHDISMGLGDRLGLASAGHIRLIKDKDIFPILAQQSIRELNLTLRTYDDVLSDAVWAVFQEGYEKGFGADGDHLKTPEEVKMALDLGFTMITLDCSEHIDNSLEELSLDELSAKYEALSDDVIKYWSEKYQGRTFRLGGGYEITVDEKEFYKTVLTYAEAISFAERIYNDFIKDYPREIDFEISIDETMNATSLQAHFIIAQEFKDRGVKMINMAPRFCGEFQKGIDYKGDIAQFTRELEVHFAISKHFGYKISVHSGSDKFSIFPIVGEVTGGKYHLKTAGTNWLEAMRVISKVNAPLFRKMYKHAVERLPDAKQFYHIFTEVDMVPAIDKLSDSELISLMNIEESRQAVHVTYGYLLCDKNEDGSYMFRDEFFDTLNEHEDEYYAALIKHIGRHIECLEENLF